MRTLALAECAEIVSGATPKSDVPDYWGGPISWATPADLARLEGPFVTSTPRTLTEKGLQSCSARLLPVGSVLLSSRAPIGYVAINTTPMATNQGFKSLIPDFSLIESGYLYHWLQAHTETLQSLGNGATFKELSKASVARIRLPVPSIEVQRRIVAILDHVRWLEGRARRRVEQVALFGERVLEPVLGSSNCQFTALADLIADGDKINYGIVQPGGVDPYGKPMIRVGDLRSGRVDRSQLKRVGSDVERRHARSRIRGNEVLISCVGTIGRVAVVSSDDVGSNIARAITRIPIDDPDLRLVIAHYLRSPSAQRYFAAELRTVSQPTLNVKQLSELVVPVPQQDLLHRAATQLRRVEKQSRDSADSVARFDRLGTALQSRAFSGQL